MRNTLVDALDHQPHPQRRELDLALAKAARNGLSDAARELIAQGARGMTDCGDGMTALMLAASLPNADCVKLLLPVSDPLAQDRVSGRTPLMIAALHGRFSSVEALLPVSNPREKDRAGDTALIFAAGNGRLDVLELLLPVSDAAKRNATHFDALACAVASTGPDIVQCARLLAPLCDARRSPGNWTPLMTAAHRGNVEIAQILIPHSDVEAALPDGATALSLALRLGHAECARAILDAIQEKAAQTESLELRAALSPANLATACATEDGAQSAPASRKPRVL